ncbi:MAG TPA: DUF1549 domain-containing protein, partial [Pirellulales bacterium]|nr:DUF1549 domain-containing protein [Pirellulales bacterium]
MQRYFAAGICLFFSWAPLLTCEAQSEDACKPPHAAKQTALEVVPLSPSELARRIDAAFATDWRAAGIMPAPPTTDAEFMRRAYLDITGKIPPVAEARSF